MAADTSSGALRLVLTVRFAEGRFHGRDDWPPSPARLFQALVAGAGHYGDLNDEARQALRWLEHLPPPVIAAPRATCGSEVTYFVPRNDGDKQRNVEDRRYPKPMRPRLFDPRTPMHYMWTFPAEDRSNGDRVLVLATRLYRLGHGVDVAWASGEIGDVSMSEITLADYAGLIHRPTGGTRGRVLLCPTRGSLVSLDQWHEGTARSVDFEGRVRVQPPRPLVVRVSYDSPSVWRLFDLRSGDAFAAWPQEHMAKLAADIGRAAAVRLEGALPARASDIARGFPPASGNRKSDRTAVRILPLPSIGHVHTPPGIRRVLVDVPGGCSLPPEDVFWAVARLDLENDAQLLRAESGDRMLKNYGIGRTATTWHTITPAALPEETKRRRIDPARQREEAKSARERAAEEMRAAVAAHHDLRLVQMLPLLDSIRVQREPFEQNGSRAEAYASGSGFVKERLWHVEIVFREPVEGPIVVGEGAHLGLGLMAPRRGSLSQASTPAGGGNGSASR